MAEQELYFRVKVGLRHSDGAGVLERRLGDPRAYTYVPDLWDWFVQKHPEGQVVGPDAAFLIARGSGWTGDPDPFCAAMVAAGFLAVIPEGFRVKGWREWAGFHLEIRAKEAAKKRAQRSDPEGQSPVCPQVVHGTSPGQALKKTASEGVCPRDASLVSDLSVSEGGTGGVPALLESDSPVAASLPCCGSAKSYGVTLAQIASLQVAYPGVDVLAEVHKARAWLESNPGRRKTHGGVARFLNAWMSREQDKPRTGPRRAQDNGRPDPAQMDYSKPPEF
jgi:hypothetical protein